MGEVHLLVSPTGGRGRAAAAAPTVRRVIEQHGHTPVDISGATAAQTADAARAAVAAGARRLVAVGGDGTLHLALQGAAGTDAVLGLVPAGTGNDFARAFGLFGLSVEQAAARALGPARPVDLIRADRGGQAGEVASPPTPAPRASDVIRAGRSRWIALNVTGGFTVDVNQRADRLRFPRGPSRYTVATLLAMPGLRHRELTVTVDGERSEHRSALFAIANTPTFGGGMAICPDADPADGLLDVCVVGAASRTTMLRLLPKVFAGGHVGHQHVEMLRGSTVTVEGEPMDLVGDGEPIGPTPITVEAVPSALNFAADP